MPSSFVIYQRNMIKVVCYFIIIECLDSKHLFDITEEHLNNLTNKNVYK